MKRFQTFAVSFCSALILFLGLGVGNKPRAEEAYPQQQQIEQPQSVQPAPQRQKVLVVRLLVLKHSRERMADDDANLAIQGANNAAAKGFPIRVVGNHYIDKLRTKDELQAFVAKEMLNGAVGGDTLIIHTIGHGFHTGSLQNIGQRSDVMAAFATAAEANGQKVLWWQLSCYASAKLPPISSLSAVQQQLISVYASSSASQSSPTREQALLMGKVFDALADKSTTLDRNSDQIITTDELRSFLDGLDNRNRGSLLYSRASDEPIFGQYFFAGSPFQGLLRLWLIPQ